MNYRKMLSLFTVFALVIFSLFPYSTVKADQSNYVIRMDIESPQNNSNVAQGSLTLSGWALDTSGIQSLNVYVDNSKVGQTINNLPRPDVVAVYSGYQQSSNCGYTYNLDLRSLNTGYHNIKVEAVATDGDKASKTITISIGQLPPRMDIEYPQNNASISNKSITISGWALNFSGVKEDDVYVDGTLIGQAQTMLPRPDVDAVYSGYKNGQNCGYQYALDLSKMTPGSHSVSVVSVGNDGSKVSKTITISIGQLPPRMDIEYPQNNASISNKSINISGWALNSSGVKEDDVYVDGVLIGQAQTMLSRADVDAVYSGYQNGKNCGYQYTVDLSKIAPGSHSISVVSVGNDGSKVSKTIQINCQKLKPRIDIENPMSNSILGVSQVNVSGWALNDSGIKQVDIYVDAQKVGQANIGLSRPDVDAVYSGYTNGINCGYTYNLSVNNLYLGKHIISAESTGNDGSKIYIDKIVYIYPPKMDIESPTANSTITGSGIYTISGWALQPAGVNRADVYLDNNKIGVAQLGLPRPDVNAVYPGYVSGVNCGYQYKLDLRSVAEGTHTISVESVGNDGQKIYKAIVINVDKISPKGDLEAINKIDTTMYSLVGWSLQDAGTNEVDVYLDNNLLGNASVGIARPDVSQVYTGYMYGSNGGFNYNVSSDKIPDGIHIVKLVCKSYDGSQFAFIKYISRIKDTISVINGMQFYNNYNYSLSYMVNKQVSNGGAVYYDPSNVNMWSDADSSMIQKYVDPMNFVNDSYGKFQFLRLDYTSGITADDLNNILVGKGILEGQGQTFLQAAQQNNISAVYLVAHALLETGNGTSNLSTGKDKYDPATGQLDGNGVSVYNMFGIGAYDSNPELYGAKTAYQNGWTTPEAAIIGGAKFIATSYINNPYYKQNTLYKMRWNPDSPGNHQYATDISWAYNQVYNIKKLLDKCKNPVLIFEIPQFN
ncbi:MAG: Ig-like domain-containing protein [Bacillota bacterium]|nr:Ig-like domain-containing protein [Bacillota bacterium]